MWLIHDEQGLIARIQAIETEAGPMGALTSDVSPRPLTVKNGMATIPIHGILLKNRSALLDRFGIRHTAYEEIGQAITTAISRGVKKIAFDIDSPGGRVEGLLSAMDVIGGLRHFDIGTEAHAGDLCASAAFMLASQTDRIIAAHDLSMLGSVGVASTYIVSPNIKHVTNSGSRSKRPDVGTKEGIAAAEAQLDDVFRVLAQRVADGRRTSVDTVSRNYGQGAIMTAPTALRKGLIDGIGASRVAASNETTGSLFRPGLFVDFEEITIE